MKSIFEQPTNGPLSLTAGTALASSVTMTDISPLGPAFPAFFFAPGDWLTLTAFGTFSTTGTPTLTIASYWGGATSGTLLGQSVATATASGAATFPWRLTLDIMCRSGGTSGTAVTSGELFLGTSLSAGTKLPVPSVAIAPITIDTTTAKNLTVAAQWGTNSASNTITCHGFGIESKV